MKRWQKILIEVMVGIVLILVILKVIEKWTGVNPIDNLRYRAEAMSDINEVASALTQEMADGKDGEVVLYIKDIPEDDLMNINYIMSNLEGSVDSFQVHAKIFGVQRVVFQIVRSDNSYVYDAYAKGIPIPEDQVEIEMNRLSRTRSDSTSSLSRDFAEQKVGEMEVFSGDLVRMAKETGVSVPVSEQYYQAMKEIAAAF